MISESAKPNSGFSLRTPHVRFLVLATFIYSVWYLTYDFYLKPRTNFDEFIIHSLVTAADGALNMLGYEMVEFKDGKWHTHLAIVGSKGVTVGAPCDGIVLFALFTVFILAYPGEWKRKLWFIPLGLLIIQSLNTFRIAALAWIVHYNESWLAFNHDYTFTIFVYSVVIGLWYWWVNKLAQPLKKTGV